MKPRVLIVSVILGLAAGWHAAAEAHEPCAGRAAYVAPTCYAATPCARSPFRITRLRTIAINASQSSPEPSAPRMISRRFRRPIRQANPCGIY